MPRRRSEPADDGPALQDARRRGRVRGVALGRVRGRGRRAAQEDRARHGRAYVKTHRVTYLEPPLERRDREPRAWPAIPDVLHRGTDPVRALLLVRAARECCRAGIPGRASCGARRRATSPRDEASAIADRTAAVLPLVASEPHVDPRAPQNLVPIGALERELRHRMGDRGLVYRALRHAVSRDPAGGLVSRRAGGARPRLPALLDERVPGRARRRRLPAARRPRGGTHPGAEGGEVRTYGVVTEAEAVYAGAPYESDTHRIAELGIMPAAKVRTAQVQVTRVDPEVWVSPDPGRDGGARGRGRARRRPSTSTRWIGRSPSASVATSCRSTSTSTSSTGARAATCRSAASRASRRRRRSRCSSCACSPSTPRSSARAPRTCGCSCST